MSTTTTATAHDDTVFDAIGKSYEDAFASDPGLHKCLERALTLLPPHSHLLDIGCGTGRPVSATLAANHHHVHGIDVSKVMVDLASTAVPEGTFEVADMMLWEPPPAEHKIGGIFAILSLFFLSRQQHEALFTKFGNWLPSGGLLLVAGMAADEYHRTKPENYDADGLCAHGVGNHFMGKDLFVTIYTKEGWKRLLEANGFEVLEDMLGHYVPPEGSDCDTEDHYFILAKKK